jgi:hypothetical protein
MEHPDDSPKGIALLIHAAPKKPMDDEPSADDGSPPEGLEDAMERFCEACKGGDAKAAASAFWDAFSLCDMAPHSEGPHDGGDEEAPEE